MLLVGHLSSAELGAHVNPLNQVERFTRADRFPPFASNFQELLLLGGWCQLTTSLDIVANSVMGLVEVDRLFGMDLVAVHECTLPLGWRILNRIGWLFKGMRHCEFLFELK
jgi:hypothetical protein